MTRVMFSKPLRLVLAFAAVAAATAVQTTAAQAYPEPCMQWAAGRCDRLYSDRYSPEWSSCFEQGVDYCESTQPGPLPPGPWHPWP